MRKISLTEKKKQKGFYSRGFQQAVNVLFFSVLVNFAFILGIHNKLIHKPVESFYATDGVVSPTLLTALDAPNESSQALLPPDEKPEKVIVEALPVNV